MEDEKIKKVRNNSLPLSKATKKSHQITYENEAAARSALIEFCIYVCFLVVTVLVAAFSRNMSMYFLNKGVENIFLSREINTFTHDASIKFAELATTADMWAFLENKFIIDLHDVDEVEENATTGESESPGDGATNRDGGSDSEATEKLIFLEQNLVLGKPRLRQLRVKEGSCDVHDVFGKYFNKCYADYASSDEDTSGEFKGAKYKTLSELEAHSIWGEIASYRSGGFVQNLTYDYNENKKILTELKTKKWLDRASRLIMVEFTLFNPNRNLMNNIKFIGELPSTGGVVTSYSIQSAKLGSVFWKDGIVALVAGILFYLFIIYYTIVEIMEVIRIGVTNYVRIMWNFVDFMIIVLAFLTLPYNIWHPFYVNTLYNKFEKNPKEFLALDTFCFWNLMYRNTLAICTFLVCIKIFKFISFNKAMRQFNATVSTCFRDLLGFGVMFGIVFLAYAQLGLLLFGNVHYDFRNFYQSLLTMIRMILGDFDYDGIEEANRVLGPIYFLTYIFLVFFILLNMFLAIINDTYSSVKSEVKGGRNHLALYLRKLFNKCCSKCLRSEPQQDEELGPSSETRPPDNQPKQSLRKEALPDYFEPVEEEESRARSSEQAKLNRLTARVAALEDVIAQLIGDVDRTMRKVVSRRRKWLNTGQQTSS